ncbi:peptidoglycan-binding protein [Streptomyces sp. NPDC002573]|uniref:peptidoglycan-binding protein n=1 Tax=Streptomyces sp. NPDC002573 TaxID=3364651 RepID=UPI003673BB7B
MVDLWMPGAARHDVGDHAPTDPTYPARAIAHITWDKNASPSAPADHISFETLLSYFTGSGVQMAPHLIWDPFTGQLAQLYPADSRSKSVVDLPGGTRTNRAGKYVIQIEAVFFPYTRYNGKVYATLADTPCKGWSDINAWTRSLGIADAWPMGHPTDFTPHRSESVWETAGGWYAHAQVPENDHVDPGSWPSFITPVKPPQPPTYEPFPGAGFFVAGRKSPIIRAMHARLVAVGCNHYLSSADADVWGPGDERSYAAWQRKLGYTGSAADGIPGPTSWTALHVPNV